LQTHSWNLGAVTALTFVDANRLAFAASGQIRVWEWRTDDLLPHSLDFSDTIRVLAADPAGERLALGTSECALHLLHIASGLRMNGQLTAASDTTCLLWDESAASLWSFAKDGDARQNALPPLLHAAPAWLPDHAEQRIGMKVDADGRVVRLRSSTLPAQPARTDAALKAWLE